MRKMNDCQVNVEDGSNKSTLLPSLLDIKGEQIQSHKSAGCGIDVHRDFAQISVIVINHDEFFEYKHEFKTTHDDILLAKKWVISIIETKSDPKVVIDPENLSYCIESTGQYHQIVLKTWGGEPELVNPQLAGATIRKTDVADASRLALHNLTGVWPSFYVPSDGVLNLRTIIAERESYIKLLTRIGNRINSILLKFGITVGREGSVTKNSKVRAKVMKLIDENYEPDPSISPYVLPDEVKALIKEEYEQYDNAMKMLKIYTDRVVEKVSSMEWETKEGKKSGVEMLALLQTVPGIGNVTSAVWLANIITPNRFPNAKACSAYCGLDPSVQVSAKHITGRKMRKGNKELHSGLATAASLLLRNHSEPIGKWGYQLYLQSGRWKKAVNAIARRLSISMYYVQSLGIPFSYEKYHLINEITVMDIPVETLVAIIPEFNRYHRILKENNFNTTSEMAAAYYNYEFAKIKGIGKKFYVLFKDFIDNQEKYKMLVLKYDLKLAAEEGKQKADEAEAKEAARKATEANAADK